MANNRMYLVHQISRRRVLIAKYFPSTGWGIHSDQLAADLAKAFDDEDFGHLTPLQRAVNDSCPGFTCPYKSSGGMFGTTEWRIEYESETDDQADPTPRPVP